MLADAQVLLAAGRAANAFYLAGYSVEMALKAVIARRFSAEDIPDRRLVADVHSHDLARLLALAELQTPLQQGSAPLKANWLTIERWSERSRYDAAGVAQAQDLVGAIGAPVDGVTPWLTTFW